MKSSTSHKSRILEIIPHFQKRASVSSGLRYTKCKYEALVCRNVRARLVLFSVPLVCICLSFWWNGGSDSFLLQQRDLHSGWAAARGSIYMDTFDANIPVRSTNTCGTVALGTRCTTVLLSR